MAMREVPVYLFTGFLDAGKTTFIQETLEDPKFNGGERHWYCCVRKERQNCFLWLLPPPM